MRNLRPWTVYGRERALIRLREWAGRPILTLDEPDLRRWQAERWARVQPEAMRTDMSHHRQFYRWAQREGYRNDDPTLRIELPRVGRRLPRPIADRLLADAIAAADEFMCGILGLAAFAGLRACEIAALMWADVTLDGVNPLVRVHEGKGGHARVVPMSLVLANHLRDLPARRGPVIPRLDGQPGPNRAHRISSRANDYLHSRGITETLHQCRHRFGTRTFWACRDIRAVQEMLGHGSPVTTALYTMASSEVARMAVEAAGTLEVSA